MVPGINLNWQKMLTVRLRINMETWSDKEKINTVINSTLSTNTNGRFTVRANSGLIGYNIVSNVSKIISKITEKVQSVLI